jgi:hypothetical protein
VASVPQPFRRVFGQSFIAAFAISRKVEQAVGRYRLKREAPPVAGREQIDAQLDALFAEILELTAPGRDVADVDRSVADACARAEEWTA